jgi:hypothetical protein
MSGRVVRYRTHYSLLIAGLLAASLAGCGDNNAQCPSPTLECGGVCVAPDVDPNNCGGCGTQCTGGEICAAGQCVVACPGTQTECGGGCFDLDASLQHCGECGNACDTGELCVNGACELACPPGLLECNGACTDPSTDPQHCGECDAPCEGDEVCSSGSCLLACPSALTDCNGGCFDLDSSPTNCGECGNACGTGEYCAAGTCTGITTCPLTDCDGLCVDTFSDPQNCGVCGNACDFSQYCAAGICTTPGTCPLTDCDGLCVDTDTNPYHCGACGNACSATAPNTVPVCASGSCGVVCATGWSDCDGSRFNGCENPTPTCIELDCSDAIDDDGDGLIDCNDSDCSADPVCVACPNGDLGSLTGNALVTGTNVGRVNDYPSSPGCGSTVSSGEDDAFLWTAPVNGCYVFDTDDSNYDTVLRLYDSCAGSELICDDNSGAGSRSLIRRDMAASEQVVVVVDGWSQFSRGTYVLDINLVGPVCTETACNDGLDDDEDGLIDCEDPDCAAAPHCYESSCSDGVDNDGDGQIDCSDTECFADPLCAGMCPNSNLGSITGNNLAVGRNAGTGNNFPSTPGCGSSSSSGDDVSFAWQAPATACYEFDTDASTYNTVLRIFDTCGGTQQVCDDDGGVSTRSLIRRDLSAGQTMVVVVDGWSSFSSGTYVLDINAVAPVCNETVCNDGIDNDNDGYIDCSDPDCATDPACYESNCTDGVDNDNDGHTDCSDTDCFANAACLGMCPNSDLGTATGDYLAVGSNVGTGNDFPSTPGCGATSSSGQDVTFAWQAPATGCYVFDTEASNYDTILRLYDSCTGTQLACDDLSGVGLTSLIRYAATAGQTMVVIVDGWASNSSGTYVLDINMVGTSCTEVNCGDGIDDDGDGYIDCADSDCNGDPLCP